MFYLILCVLLVLVVAHLCNLCNQEEGFAHRHTRIRSSYPRKRVHRPTSSGASYRPSSSSGGSYIDGGRYYNNWYWYDYLYPVSWYNWMFPSVYDPDFTPMDVDYD